MATVTLRIDDSEKKALDKALDNIGMNISTFYSIYTKKFLHEKKIPFDISVAENDSFYSEENMKHLSKSIARLEEGKGQLHELIEE